MTRPTGPMRLVEWPIDRIQPRTDNPRRVLRDIPELAASIRELDLLEPLVVEHIPPGAARGYVTLIDGHRRLAALRMLGRPTAPVIPRWVASHIQALVVILAKSGHHHSHDPVDEALAYQRLRATGMTSRGIAHATGIPEARISSRLRLLELDESTQRRVSAGELPVTRAVGAVRAVRQQAAGRVPTPVAAPTHFGRRHRLASVARDLCNSLGHPGRGRLGSVACGPCWEHAIRTDQDQITGRAPSQPTGGAV